MNIALADLRPYKAMTTRDFFPERSGPNSEPKVVHILSEQGLVKYEFYMSDVLTYISFNAASVRAMWKLSLETAPAYVNVGGKTVA